MYKFNRELNGQRILRKNFGSDSDYLSAIYDANKQKIDEAFGANARSKFISRVQSSVTMKRYNVKTVPQALKAIEGSEVFRPYTERAIDNLKSQMQYQGLWKDFRTSLRTKKGTFEKYDPKKWKYQKEGNVYVYDNRVVVGWATDSRDGMYLQDKEAYDQLHQGN